MTGYSFETFQVDDANRTAFDACRRVAALQYDGPRPVVLLGPEGSGKSHLLWSVVKEVRASAVKTGLALIMAQEFPDKVRDLVKNPGPIQQGRPAILLVDGLEQFKDNIGDLEAVVQLFLIHGHEVLVASNVHPDRLGLLSGAFQKVLGKGRLVEIRPFGGTETRALHDEISALKAELEQSRQERDALEQKLAEKAAATMEVSGLRAQLAASHEERTRLEKQLADNSALEEERAGRAAEVEALNEQLGRLEAEHEALRAERDALEVHLAEKAEVQNELERAQARLLEQTQAGETMKAAAAEKQLEVEQAQSALAAQSEQLKQRQIAFEELSQTLELAQGALAEQTQAREQAQGSLAERAQELEQAQTALAERSQELEQAQNAMAEQARELETARADLAVAQEEAEGALAEQARLQGLLGAKASLEQALETACADRDAAREEARSLSAQAESLLAAVTERMETGQAQRRQMHEGLRRVVAEFAALGRGFGNTAVVERLEAESEQAQAEAEAFRAQMEQDQRWFEEELSELRAVCADTEKRIEEESEERRGLQEGLSNAESRLKTMEFELEKAWRQVTLQVAEMDALRHEAASQVASANVQAGEMENRLGRLASALDVARDTCRAAGGDAQRLIEVFVHGSAGLREIVARLAAVNALAVEPAPEREDWESQRNLFEAGLFECVPSDLGASGRPAEGAAGPDPRLKQVVDDFFALEDEPDTGA